MGGVFELASGQLLEVGELARGGMGSAHLVFKRGEPQTLFVLKRLRPGLVDDAEALRRFRHEAALSQAVRHPQIVRTLSAGTDHRGPYLLLEYVHGTHLMDLTDRALLRRSRLSWQSVVGVGLQASLGLSALHAAKDEAGRHLRISHRDISPQNLLVEHTGRVVLSDFGISKSRLSTVSTDASHMLGKLAYMSPEYLRQALSIPAGDVYSLAVTLWVALTGRLPFGGDSETQMLRAILSEGVPPVRASRPEVPERLSDLLGVATSIEPERRPSAEQFHGTLSEIFRLGGLASSPEELVVSEVDRVAGADLTIKRQVYLQQARQLHDESRGN